MRCEAQLCAGAGLRQHPTGSQMPTWEVVCLGVHNNIARFHKVPPAAPNPIAHLPSPMGRRMLSSPNPISQGCMSMPLLLGVRTELAPPLPAVRAEERDVTETCND